MPLNYQCSVCSSNIACKESYYRVLDKRNPEHVCRKCRLRGRLKEHAAANNISDEGRDCVECKRFLPWEMFAGRKRHATAKCKDCHNAAAKTRWYEDEEFRNKQRRSSRNSHLRRHYGIDIDAYEAMLATQGGKCLICATTEDLCVDHNHVTGDVRGLICRACNKALGLFKDSTDVLERAKEYLLGKAV